ncbi:pyroglutamyl-peptidase 1-like [Trichoplusia ni]|uniref:Pyroglutamyl-peptidase 1-like n=1 Tax=Trichoplusia ni TaxID=7111 RepID=A0A7E5WGE5_TRINI|nr:pyroglutamyl-peptidase 1-like [Trichoplusia ni]
MEDGVTFDMITRKVLMTGFAPFGMIDRNPSWDGVDAIRKEEVEMKHNIELFKEQIEVRYTHVDESVPRLWRELQPDLTIHVGVSDQTDCFLLETKANRKGYEIDDVDGILPDEYQCTANGPDELKTRLDVHVLSKEFNMEPPLEGLETRTSESAGNFLCEYLYYKSLHRDASKTLFIHVPLDQYTTDEIAAGLERILEICLRQVQSRDLYNFRSYQN